MVLLLREVTLIHWSVPGMCAMDYDGKKNTGLVVDDVSRCK